MLEVEVKLWLDDVEALRSRLRETGATEHGTTHEEDIYFRHPCRDFAATDEALRIRNGSILTYKGPRDAAAEVKVRAEHELPVPDEAACRALLAGLGFEAAATVRKHRATFHLDGVVVTLDHLEDVGHFAEIEVVGADAQAAIKHIEHIREQLGLSGARMEPASYLELAMAAKRAKS